MTRKKISEKILILNFISFTLYCKALFMNMHQEESLNVLADIRNIMDRSSRVLSLSGWSGIWAGLVAILASILGYQKLQGIDSFLPHELIGLVDYFFYLALATFLLALLGAFYFTYKKNKKQGSTTVNPAAKRMIISMSIPMLAGAWMVFFFLYEAQFLYLVPTMLIFYGMTLINSSKYTISDIKWLGLLEIICGCLSTLKLEWGLLFWAVGFGCLHIIYGIIMWRKYDRK
jgi:hypothetical protein